jgi:hypothetical protein
MWHFHKATFKIIGDFVLGKWPQKCHKKDIKMISNRAKNYIKKLSEIQQNSIIMTMEYFPYLDMELKRS